MLKIHFTLYRAQTLKVRYISRKEVSKPFFNINLKSLLTFFVCLPNCLIIFVKVSEKMWEWKTKQCKYFKKKIDEVLQQNKGKLKFSLFRLYIKENNERVFSLHCIIVYIVLKLSWYIY